MAWACVDWADMRITLFGDDEAFEKISSEASLITISHLGDFDWLVGVVFAEKFRFLKVKKKDK